jgi:hypothetical protein
VAGEFNWEDMKGGACWEYGGGRYEGMKGEEVSCVVGGLLCEEYMGEGAGTAEGW